MKAILVIDVPQEDIGKSASIMYLGHDKYLRSIEFIPIQPMPMKKASLIEWFAFDKPVMYTYNPNDYDKGWNDCIDILEGEE